MSKREVAHPINSPARQAGRGFTLIELVAVIVILAVLAAVAVPRFLNISSDARIAAIKTAAGAISATAMQVNLKCRATVTCVDPGNGQMFLAGPDGSINALAYGYPTGRVPTNGYWGINDWVVLPGFTAIQIDSGNTDFTKNDAPDPSHCKIRYTEALASGWDPSVIFTTTGC